MKSPRLRARPVSEGIRRTENSYTILWRDFIWDNGQTVRMWFIDPELVDETNVEVHLLGPGCPTEGSC